MDGKLLILVLALLGFGLLYLEIFLPGLVAGALGVLFLVASIYEANKLYGPIVALVVLLGEVIVVGLGLMAWARFFPNSGLGKRMILKDFGRVPRTVQEEILKIGEEGKAVTELRPAGTAEFAGKRFDVVAESAFIPSGESVRVHQIEKYRVVVRKV